MHLVGGVEDCTLYEVYVHMRMFAVFAIVVWMVSITCVGIVVMMGIRVSEVVVPDVILGMVRPIMVLKRMIVERTIAKIIVIA